MPTYTMPAIMSRCSAKSNLTQSITARTQAERRGSRWTMIQYSAAISGIGGVSRSSRGWPSPVRTALNRGQGRRQRRAMGNRGDLDKIKASVLLINDAEDHANPPELGTVERAIKRVRDGRYVLIPAGPNTHGHFSHFYAELWKPYLIEFMNSLGPPKAAAAD